MAKKQYLDLAGLTEYDELIKGEIADGDSATLASAKSYADGLVTGGHTHDDRYYTESEIDSKIAGINTSITNITSGTTIVKKAEYATSAGSASTASEATHATSADSATTATKATQDGNGKVISSTYETKTDASAKLTEAKGYTDTEVAKKADKTHNHDDKYDTKGAASTAESNAKAYADEKVANLLDNSTEAVDSIMELAEAMKDNADAIEALEGIAAGKANATHTHAIGDVTNLQSTLNAKAAQTDLDSHIADTTKHITSTERTNWGTAYTHSQSAHAPSNAQANVIESIKVNGTAQTITSKAVNITVPTKTSDLTHDSGFLVASDIANKANKATTLSGYGITNAYTKTEVDALTTADSSLSSTSTKPVQNKVVNSAIVSLTNTIGTNTSSISTHTGQISALETKVGDGFEEITSAEIQALFA